MTRTPDDQPPNEPRGLDAASTPTPKRRFIAGAVCPKCQALDRIVVERAAVPPTANAGDSEVVTQRRCVACGFVEVQTTQASADSAGGLPAYLPRGRAERPRTSVADDAEPTQVVKIVDSSGRPEPPS